MNTQAPERVESTKDFDASFGPPIPGSPAYERKRAGKGRASAELAGDHLNAERFLADHATDVLWVPELTRWFVWNGSWWAEDRAERVQELARQTVDRLRPWVQEPNTSPEEMKRRAAHYASSARSGRVEALLLVARYQDRIKAAVEELDRDPYLLACRNGTVDLRTGDLRSAQRKDLLTRGVAVDFDLAARSDLWERFLGTTFGGDSELIAYVQRLMGYSSTGVVTEHVAPVFHGSGANGKSTFVGVICDLLGDAAIVAPQGLFTADQRFEPHPERIATLRGRRLVVTYELEQRVTLAEGLVKTLTGGDRLSAREIQGRRFEFAPNHKVLIVTNHRPRVRGTDESIWRRLWLVPFTHTVEVADRIRDLREQLVRDHGKAVVAWLVAGAVAWFQSGLGEARAVTAATASYRADQDTMAAFLAEVTEADSQARVKVGNLWKLWQQWSEAAGERPGRKQEFSTALADHGFEIETYQGARFAKGLREVSLGLNPTYSREHDFKTYRVETSRDLTARSNSSASSGPDPLPTAPDGLSRDTEPATWPDGTPYRLGDGS
ncbi:MAG: DNA primase family protein [Candidatus Dormibacteria bacterium]